MIKAKRLNVMTPMLEAVLAKVSDRERRNGLPDKRRGDAAGAAPPQERTR